MELNKYEEAAMQIIKKETTAWDGIDSFVSDSASFNMRDEIDNARKNYYGKFNQTTDSDTGLKKLFVPLTEWTVESIVKNIDLDLKDIHVKAPEGKDKAVATIVKLVTLHFLKRINFSETLNDLIRRLTIDGTAIVKIFPQFNKEFGRNMPQLRIVDPLNIVIDPTAYSLHDVPFIEKSRLSIDEIERHTDWKNKDHIVYQQGSVPTTTVVERWGKIPLSFVTQNEEDHNKWVEGVIIGSINSKDNPKLRVANTSIGDSDQEQGAIIIHKIARNKMKFKPYEETWLKRTPSRWFGRGIPEQLRHLQEWMNTVVNIRRDEALNKLAGKYKIRKGGGIGIQHLQGLKAGGAIVVEEMDDIQELSERDVKPSAYQEPQEILSMADRVTGSFDISRGEGLPASLPATTAVLQDRGARSTFSLIQENIGLFLERVLRRHIIPMVLQQLKEGEVVRITGELEDLEILDQAAINAFVNEMGADKGIFEKRRLRKQAEEKLASFGKDRFAKIQKFIFDTFYDVEVYVTDEKFDPAVMVRQLNDLLFQYSNIPGANLDVDGIMREVLDTMGISGTRFIKPGGAPGVSQPRALGAEQPNAQSNIERAALRGNLSPAER